MNKRKKQIKSMMRFLFGAGALFILLAILLYLSSGSFVGIKFPNAVLAPVGFAVVGAIYVISATGMLLMTQNKKALLEENDERTQMIQAKSATIAFGVQTLLFFTGIVLLIFTGYLNAVAAVLLAGILLVSMIAFAVSQLYFTRKL